VGFVRKTFVLMIPSLLASPASFLPWTQRSQRAAGKGREGISKLRPFFIFNNAKDVVENYCTAADNIRPIEIPDLTIVRQE
jgi:hypothetical protein